MRRLSAQALWRCDALLHARHRRALRARVFIHGISAISSFTHRSLNKPRQTAAFSCASRGQRLAITYTGVPGKLALPNNATWHLVFLPHRRLAMGNSIKEAISIMNPKKIFNTILAVLFVFPLMGTFAQQAPSSGSIEVIMTFDYPGAGNLTLPQKITKEATSLASSSIRTG